jgi:hypothetical protein
MPIWCRLCRDPVVEGSLFCARHRAQAAFFSQTFAPTAPAGGAGETPAVDTPPRADESSPHADEPPRSPAVARCAQLVAEALAELSKSAAPAVSGDRWPQISVYYLQEQLYARTYYSVVPAQAASATQPRIDLQHPALRAAMAPTGRILTELLAHFAANEAVLKRRHVQTLDLHFLTYAGLVAINLHKAGSKDVNLLTLAVSEDGLTPVTLDSVRPRLFHKRW